MSTATFPQTSISRRRFDDDLKLHVVRLVRDQKLPAAQVCRDFNISSGSPRQRRIRATLRSQGVNVGRHRVRRMMREQALKVRWRRKHVHTTDSRQSLLGLKCQVQRFGRIF